MSFKEWATTPVVGPMKGKSSDERRAARQSKRQAHLDERTGKAAAKRGISVNDLAHSFLNGQYYISDDRFIVEPRGRHSLHGAQATVDTSGSKSVGSRSTATRMILTGGLAGQKTITADTRKVFLTVVGDGWSFVVKASASKEQDARAFAAQINAVSRIECHADV